MFFFALVCFDIGPSISKFQPLQNKLKRPWRTQTPQLFLLFDFGTNSRLPRVKSRDRIIRLTELPPMRVID